MVTPPRTPPGLQITGSLGGPDAAISPSSSRQHYFPYTLDFQRGRIITIYIEVWSSLFLWYQTEVGSATLNVKKTLDATMRDCWLCLMCWSPHYTHCTYTTLRQITTLFTSRNNTDSVAPPDSPPAPPLQRHLTGLRTQLPDHHFIYPLNYPKQAS